MNAAESMNGADLIVADGESLEARDLAERVSHRGVRERDAGADTQKRVSEVETAEDSRDADRTADDVSHGARRGQVRERSRSGEARGDAADDGDDRSARVAHRVAMAATTTARVFSLSAVMTAALAVAPLRIFARTFARLLTSHAPGPFLGGRIRDPHRRSTSGIFSRALSRSRSALLLPFRVASHAEGTLTLHMRSVQTKNVMV